MMGFKATLERRGMLSPRTRAQSQKRDPSKSVIMHSLRIDVTGSGPGYTLGKIRDAKVFVGPYRRDVKIFVVQERDLAGKFVQVVILLGWLSRQKALEVWMQAHGETAGQRFGGSVEMTPKELRDWLANGDRAKPLERVSHWGWQNG
jgi:hypothetical protein